MPENTNPEDDLFEAALLRSPGPERAAFLDGECRSDPELRARVEMMLEGHLNAQDFLETLPNGVAPERKIASPETAGLEQLGSHIGPYKLLQKLGEGGCGLVYLAEQNQPVRRRVALKVIKLGMDTRSVIARFEAERQALALMDHPNIAKVFDAGTTETGRPYFVMELVRGTRISGYCDQNNLSTGQRLSLFIQVCQAIQHAHQKGIIHRDIKPSNILITLHDGVPVPKVIDFGIAKATCEQRLTDKTIFTAFEQFIGTPAYMSPEQAEMSGLDIDTRSDIYSLGVLLYELLTGSAPFDAKELLASGLDAMRKTIREKEPLRPSTKLSQTLVGADVRRLKSPSSDTPSSEEEVRASSRRLLRLKETIALLRGDLDWIIMKCLEKDRTRRYETANGLAADLKRHLSHEPVIARPPSTAYRFQKAFRRNKLVFTAATAVAAALVVGIAVSAWLATVATRARNEAQNNLQKVIAAAATLRNQVYVGEIGLAHKAIQEGNLGRARALLGKHTPRSGEADLRGFEWRFLKSRLKREYQADLGLYEGFLSTFALSPDGQFLALIRYDPQRVEVIHLASRTVTNSIPVEGVEFLSYAPSGNFLVGGGLGKVIRWDTRTWEAREAVALKFPLVFSHRTVEELFVACHTNDHLEVWSATTWQKIADLTNAPAAGPLLEPSFPANGASIGALAISSGDDIVYRAGAKGIRRWDLRQRNEIAPFAIPGMDLLATSEAGHLAAAEHTGKVHLINPELGEISYTFSSHLAWISALKFSRDGRRLVSASADRKIVVHHPGNRRDVRQLLGHETEVWALDLSADGETIVSGAGGGHVLTWSLADTVGGGLNLAEAKRCAVLDDGRILIHRASAKDLEYYDPVKGTVEPVRTQRFVPASTKMDVDLLEVSPNAKWAVSAEGTNLVVWNVLAGGRERTLSHQSGKVNWAKFSPDSRFVLTTGNDSEVRLWRTDHWTSDTLCQQVPKLEGIGFSGNSQRVAIAGFSRFIKVFDLARELREILLEKEKDDSWPSYACVAISKSGRWLAAGSTDNLVRIWDLETGKRAEILQGHVQGVWSVSFSADERTLASSCVARLMLWQVGSWQELLSINEPIIRIEFSPNGQYLVGWERSDQTVTGSGLPRRLESPRIWPAPTLAELDAETAHGQPATELR